MKLKTISLLMDYRKEGQIYLLQKNRNYVIINHILKTSSEWVLSGTHLLLLSLCKWTKKRKAVYQFVCGPWVDVDHFYTKIIHLQKLLKWYTALSSFFLYKSYINGPLVELITFIYCLSLLFYFYIIIRHHFVYNIL